MSLKPATEAPAAWDAEDLRAWRQRLGFTVAEAGARLGRTEDAMKQLLSGRRKIGPGARVAAEQAERDLAGRARLRRKPAAPRSPAPPEPSPTAVADEALLEVALAYAGAITARVHAVSFGTLTRGHIDVVNAAANRLDAVSEAGGYCRAAGARAVQVVRCAHAAMDALQLLWVARRELKAMRTAAEHEQREEVAPDLAEYVDQMVDEPDEAEQGNPDSDEMYEPQVFHGRNGDAGNGTAATILAGKGAGWSVQDGSLLVVLEPTGNGLLDAAQSRLLRALTDQEAADRAAKEAERKVNAAQNAVDRAQAAWEEKQKPAPANRRRAPIKTRP